MRAGFTMPEEVKQRFSMWWRGEDFGRPLCRIIGRTEEPNFSLRGVSPRDFHIGAAVRVAMMREEMRVSRYFADAFPYLDLNLGPGSLAAYLGCEPKFSYDTVWYEPCAETIAELPEKDFMRFSPWWEEHLREVRETVRLSEGEFPVGIPDVQENIDILAAMRGAQNLCYDLMKVRQIIAMMKCTVPLPLQTVRACSPPLPFGAAAARRRCSAIFPR